MGALNYGNGKIVKSHLKFGIVSFISSGIAFFMSIMSIFNPNEYVWLRQHNKVLFNTLAVTQSLLIIGAVVFSLIDIQKKESKKLLPMISIMLIGILILVFIKLLMDNNLL